MATATKKKPEPVFSKKEAEEKAKALFKEKYDLSPVSVDEYGYSYDMGDILNKVHKAKK